MTPPGKFPTEHATGMPRSTGRRRQSVSTGLVVWNIVSLAVLLFAFGGVVRYTVTSTIMASIDRELMARVRPMVAPPPRDVMGGPDGRRPPPDAFGMPGGPPGPEGFGGPGGFDIGPPRGMGGPGSPRSGTPYGDSEPTFRPPPPDENRIGRPNPRDNDVEAPRRYGLDAVVIGPQTRKTPWDTAGFDRAKAGVVTFTDVTIDGRRLHVLSIPFPDHGPIEGVIQCAYPLTDVDLAIAGLDKTLLALSPIALLCAGLAGALLTRRVLRRVHGMTAAAARIGGDDFSDRLPVTGDDEFAELGDTFNSLLGRLEAALVQQRRLVEQQRRFTADASHELKTPLTVIKGNTSMVLATMAQTEPVRETIREIDRAADSMSRLVQDLLLLARSDAGRLGQNGIDLLASEVVQRAASAFRRPPCAPIIVDAAGDAMIRGNEEEIVRLFTNLVSNAARHTPRDGRISVSAALRGDRVEIVVADTGCGIAPEHLPHLGERFYRVDASRARVEGASGLGLSICRGIVDAHGGTMQIESAVGAGTRVTVRLPAPGG
ncbi:MAG: sensor histidine kinase [Capsulimonadaceae bacterium]